MEIKILNIFVHIQLSRQDISEGNQQYPASLFPHININLLNNVITKLPSYCHSLQTPLLSACPLDRRRACVTVRGYVRFLPFFYLVVNISFNWSQGSAIASAMSRMHPNWSLSGW